MPTMDDTELRSVVEAAIRGSTSSLHGSDGGGDLANQRKEALEFYYAEKFGNEVEGRSEIVSHDVSDVIEWLLPGLLEVFVASDDVVRFEPQGMEDEEAAKQATEYVNWIFNRDNPGFKILFDMFKDALLQKTGTAKVFWEETEEEKRETFTGLTDMEVAYLADGDDVEVVEHSAGEIDDTGAQLYDMTLLRKVADGRVRIETFPPDELLVSRRAEDIKNSPFVGHRTQKTVTDLLEMGFDPEVVERLPSHDEAEYNEERLARFQADDEWPVDADNPDASMRPIWVTECYIRVDYDGDGRAELRKITVAGSGNDLLDNEAIDECPIVSLTPIPIPHKFFGLSVADQVMDLQKIKSTIQRQMLDNMYNVNNARVAVSEEVEIDDWLTNRVGGVVRVKGKPGEHIMPLVTPPLGPHAFPLLEYIDQERESRTGVSRYNQGLDPDALNDTAKGISIIQSASLKRQTLIARVFAETGVKEMFAKILRLVIKHQQRPRMIRLRNQWVPMDPKAWNANMDVSIAVGLGHGNREQQMFMYNQILNFQREIIELQEGVNGPLVTLENVHNALGKFVESGGVKSIEPFFNDPANAEQVEQEPEPDPKMMEIQAKMQLEQMKFEHDVRMTEAKMAEERDEAQADMELKREQARLQAQLEAQKAQRLYELEILKAQMQNALEREKAGLQIEVSAAKLAADLEMKDRELRANGKDEQ